MPVNPKYQAIEGVLTYPSIDALPLVPDLAVISTPPETVPGIIEALGRKGTRAAVVITAGFGESEEAVGRALQQALLDSARPYLLRIIGPNCLGILVPGIGLNASFAHLTPAKGPIAFVAQSGAIITSVMDWAERRGIGFSHLVSLGDMADVDFGDLLDYLASNPETRAILLYIEAVTEARKFMSAARAAARMKPTIVVKAGRHAEGARAAASHTGAMAGSDAVYEAVFRRAGMLRVYSLDELFDAVEILAMAPRAKGPRMAILSNGGGLAVLATDHLIDEGGVLAELAPQTLDRLNAALPPTWSHHNPVDIVGDAPGSRYAQALSALMEDLGVDAVLALNCPTAVASDTEAAQALIEAMGERRDPTLITSWVGDGAAEEARRMFRAHGIPSYATPGQAVRAFMYLVNYRRSQELLMQTPPSVPEEFTPDTEAARALIGRAMGEGRRLAHRARGQGAPRCLRGARRRDAVRADAGRGGRDRRGDRGTRGAQDPLPRHHPQVRPRGSGLGPPWAGAVRGRRLGDARAHPRRAALGPHRGFQRAAHGAPPRCLRAHRRHDRRCTVRPGDPLRPGRDGGRGHRRPGPWAAAAQHAARRRDHHAHPHLQAAQGVSRRPAGQPRGYRAHAHPHRTDGHRAPRDRRARYQPAARRRKRRHCPRCAGQDCGAAGGRRRTARHPALPQGLEEEVALAGGQRILLRPIRPEDEPALQAIFAHLTPEQVRMRFFVSLKSLSHAMAARITQVDYDREMGLVLSAPGVPGRVEIYGVVQVMRGPG